MKKFFGILVVAMLLIAVVPLVAALPPAAGGGIGISIDVNSDPPKVYMDPLTRVLYTEPEDGRVVLADRVANYAFMGEQLQWQVLVYDKNGVETIGPVSVVLTDEQVDCQTDCIGEGCEDYECTDGTCICADSSIDLCGFDAAESIEVQCIENLGRTGIDPVDPLDDEGDPILWDSLTMRWYTCTLTVEDWEGEYWVVAVAQDDTCLWGSFDENEYWYFNPAIQLTISDSELLFDNISPGERDYSQTILVTNDAAPGSGVQLRAGISGFNLFDSSPSNAMCPNSNELALTNFGYYATLGSYDTCLNIGADSECYDIIAYEDGSDAGMNPAIGPDGDLYGREWIIESNQGVLPEGGDIAITFRLDMPKPCQGNFDAGMGPNGEFVMFWAEAM